MTLLGALLFELADTWLAPGSSWLGASLAAFWSSRAMFFVHGASMSLRAAAWMEAVVAVLFALAALIVVMSPLRLWVFRRGASRSDSGDTMRRAAVLQVSASVRRGLDEGLSTYHRSFLTVREAPLRRQKRA
jgi:hypothetical protein